MQVHLVDGTYELFRQFLAPRPGHQGRRRRRGRRDPGGRSASVLAHARGWRDPPRGGDRSRHPVVPQRPLGRLQDRRGHRPRAVRPVPAARGRARRDGRDGVGDGRARSRRRARDQRPRSRPRIARVEQAIICTPDKDLGQCVGGKVVQLDRRKESCSTPTACARSSACRPSRFPTTSRSWATAPTASPACRASARSRRPRCCAATGTSRRSPTTARHWDVAGLRSVDRLATTLAGGPRGRRPVQGARDAPHRRRRRHRRRLGVDAART